jgi:hypothetical protein
VLVAGLALLCGGSKSAKLAALWQSFDRDGDGLLTREELSNLLGAVLLALYALRSRERDPNSALGNPALSGAVTAPPLAETASEVRGQEEALCIADQLAASVFDWVAEHGEACAAGLGAVAYCGVALGRTPGNHSGVSFAAFAAFYNAAGYPQCAFLEMLNLGKLQE